MAGGLDGYCGIGIDSVRREKDPPRKRGADRQGPVDSAGYGPSDQQATQYLRCGAHNRTRHYWQLWRIVKSTPVLFFN